MKKNIFSAILASAIVLMPAIAQERPPGPRSGQAMIEHAADMARQLDLTEEQAIKLRELLAEHAKLTVYSAQLVRQALSELLTEEQRQQMSEMGRSRERTGEQRRRAGVRMQRGYERRTRMARARSEHWMRRSNERRNQWTAPDVRLSPDQQEALRAVRKEVAESRKKFAEENPVATKEEKRTFSMAQRQKLADTMDTILTAEQQLMMMRRAPLQRRPRSILALSAEQEEKIKEALSAHRAAQQLWVEANLDATPLERLEHARTQRETIEATLKEILTPEQLLRLDRSSQDRGRKGRQRRGRRGY